MTLATDLINLRKRVADAVKLGVVGEDSKDIYEATLIQILNEAERGRIRCTQLVQDFERKKAQAEAQANTYSQISSIVYNIINGFVISAEKGIREEAELANERGEPVEPASVAAKAKLKIEEEKKAEEQESKPEEEPKRKRTRRTTRKRR
jgi:hypothetical protein